MFGQVWHSQEDGKWRIRTLAGASGSGLPLGTIVAVYSNTVPAGYLPCNGVEYDVIQYPALYTLLHDNHTPDLREVTLVGAGESTRDSIASHDVYTIGQFKDDQIQQLKADINLGTVNVNIHDPGHTHVVTDPGHTHPTAYGNVSGTQSYLGGAGTVQTAPSQSATTGITLERSTTGITADLDSPDVTIALSNYRAGAVTRGKSVGVQYIIKANTGLNEIDDDAVYAQVVGFIQDNYTQSGDLEDIALVRYDRETNSFVTIERPTVDGTVLAFHHEDGYTERFEEDYWRYESTLMNDSGETVVLPDDYVLEDSTAIGDVVWHEDNSKFYYSEEETDPETGDVTVKWFELIRFTEDHLEGTEISDADLIAELEELTPVTVYYETYVKTVEHEAVNEYHWVDKAESGLSFIGTRAQYEAAKSTIKANTLVLITDSREYLTGEDR